MVDTRQKGAFEELVSKIEELLPAEGGWWINEGNFDKELCIHTKVSRDPSRSHNGGEYDFYACFAVVGDGILVYENTSCELRIDGMGRDAGYVIPVIIGLGALRRIAALVGLRSACKLFLKRGIGFGDLKDAVELAS